MQRPWDGNELVIKEPHQRGWDRAGKGETAATKSKKPEDALS